MLSTKTNKSLTDLYAISSDEEKFKQSLLAFIKQEKTNLTLEEITNADHFLLFALAETHTEINQFLDTHPELQKNWALILGENDYINFPLKSYDGKKELSLFAQLKGVILLDAVKISSDITDQNTQVILNRACDIGMHNALLKRIKLNIQRIKELGRDTTNLQNYIEVILYDAEKMGKLYWSYGCVFAGLELLDLANYLNTKEVVRTTNERFFQFGSKDFSWVDTYDNERNLPLFIIVIKRAIELLYLAVELAKFDMSEKIEGIMQHGGLGSILGDYRDPSKFEQAIIVKLNEFRIPLKETFCRRASEKAVEIARKHVRTDKQIQRT